jgi:hypothetical protein
MSQTKLKDEERDSYGNEGYYIGNQECSSAITVSHTAEAPDVPQADGTTYGGKQETDPTFPLLSFNAETSRIFLNTCNHKENKQRKRTILFLAEPNAKLVLKLAQPELCNGEWKEIVFDFAKSLL